MVILPPKRYLTSTICDVEQKIMIRLSLILGVYEALELRDGGSDYLGKGVSKVSCLLLNIVQYMCYLC